MTEDAGSSIWDRRRVIIDTSMLLRSLLLTSAVVCSLSAADPSLNRIKFVYLLSMGGGLDQYLANRHVQTGRFSVVTNPSQADAIFTDQLGVDFERRMEELYPPPAPPEEPKEEEAKDKEQGEQPQGQMNIGSAFGEVAGQKEPVITSFGRGKGNVFLVDRESRQVIWSRYVRPRSTRPDELDQVANEIAGKLANAAKQASKTAPPATPVEPSGAAPAPVSPAPPPGTTAPASK
jgi:hypothetical protein